MFLLFFALFNCRGDLQSSSIILIGSLEHVTDRDIPEILTHSQVQFFPILFRSSSSSSFSVHVPEVLFSLARYGKLYSIQGWEPEQDQDQDRRRKRRRKKNQRRRSKKRRKRSSTSSTSSVTSILTQFSEVFLDILTMVENEPYQKLYRAVSLNR